MRIPNQEFYNFLKSKGVTHLFHANTEKTSTSFIQQCGLLSRGAMEQNGMPLSYQYSDQRDKEVGVWFDIFLDDVDIHERASKRNLYGPVLFRYELDILLNNTFHIYVTKSNPADWMPNHTNYFLNMDEISNGYRVGTFEQMITLKNMTVPLYFLPSTTIILDDHVDPAFIQFLQQRNINYIMRNCTKNCCQ